MRTLYFTASILCVVLSISQSAYGQPYEGFPRIPPKTSALSWNIGAGDLLRPETAACRLGVYLDELTARGDKKEIRIIYTYEWGPFIREHWIPVIRAKGFRLLIILSQHANDKDLSMLIQWLDDGVRPIIDLVDAIQLDNETDLRTELGGEVFGAWYRSLSAAIRQRFPTVPIVSPSIHPGNSGSFIRWAKLVYGVDFDIFGINLAEAGKSREKRLIKGALKTAKHPSPRIWITEGRVPSMTRLNDWIAQKPSRGMEIERTYVYTWNCNAEGGCDRRSKRPGEEDVPQCDRPH